MCREYERTLEKVHKVKLGRVLHARLRNLNLNLCGQRRAILSFSVLSNLNKVILFDD